MAWKDRLEDPASTHIIALVYVITSPPVGLTPAEPTIFIDKSSKASENNNWNSRAAATWRRGDLAMLVPLSRRDARTYPKSLIPIPKQKSVVNPSPYLSALSY